MSQPAVPLSQLGGPAETYSDRSSHPSSAPGGATGTLAYRSSGRACSRWCCCGDDVVVERVQGSGWAGLEPARTRSGCWCIRRYWPGVMPYSRRNWRLKLDRF